MAFLNRREAADTRPLPRRARMAVTCVIAVLLILLSVSVPVAALSRPTSTGLTEFASLAQKHRWGYVFGTYGQEITPKVVERKQSQYADMYARVLGDGRSVFEHALEWVGGRATDCAGLIKAYLWWRDDGSGPKYDASTDRSANGIYASATVKGPISTIPDTHGVLVWRDGHIGIYVGNGEVIEARGVAYGVVRTRLSERRWTGWCLHPQIAYPTTGWYRIGGETFYYRDGQYVTGAQSIDGKAWRFAKSGALQPGQSEPPVEKSASPVFRQPDFSTFRFGGPANLADGEPAALQRDDISPDVQDMQARMTQLGFLTGPIDGIFGPLTEFAVLSVQKQLALELNGRADRDFLDRLAAENVPVAPARKQADALSYGDEGAEVFILQTRLRNLGLFTTEPGGHFGPETRRAVQALQKLHNLPVTGIAGTEERRLAGELAALEPDAEEPSAEVPAFITTPALAKTPASGSGSKK